MLEKWNQCEYFDPAAIVIVIGVFVFTAFLSTAHFLITEKRSLKEVGLYTLFQLNLRRLGIPLIILVFIIGRNFLLCRGF